MNDRQRQFGGFARKKDAEARLRVVREEIVAGAPRPESTFQEFADRWMVVDSLKRYMTETLSW